MRKLFIPLLLFSALEANEKNGFFIEAGFETGLLEGTQTQEQRRTTTKNTYATYNYLPTDAVLKRAANLFTDAKSISQLCGCSGWLFRGNSSGLAAAHQSKRFTDQFR
ncbi:hypothetical protein JP0142_11220 [Helicobacter pylori]